MSDTTVGRRRFPNREAGCPDVSRGSARKKAQQRDNGETVTVSNPQVSTPPKKAAGKKHPKIDGGNLKS